MWIGLSLEDVASVGWTATLHPSAKIWRESLDLAQSSCKYAEMRAGRAAHSRDPMERSPAPQANGKSMCWMQL